MIWLHALLSSQRIRLIKDIEEFKKMSSLSIFEHLALLFQAITFCISSVCSA